METPENFIQSKCYYKSIRYFKKNIDKSQKSEDLKIIAKDTVDIRGYRFLHSRKARKSITNDQLQKYSNFFKQYFLKSFSSRLSEYTNPKLMF